MVETRTHESTEKPAALFIIDRARHWSSRAWLAVTAAAAYRERGAAVYLAVDCLHDSNPGSDLDEQQRMKPDLIVRKATELGLRNFITLPIGRKRPAVHKWSYWAAVKKLAAFLDEKRIDVVHIHRRTHHLTAFAVRALAKHPVLVVRGCARADRTLEPRFPHTLFYSRLAAVNSFSRAMNEMNGRVPGIDPAICHEIPVALSRQFTDTRHTREQGRRFIRERYGMEAELLFGYVGAIEPEKQPWLVVEAVHRFGAKHPGMKVILVGQPDPRTAEEVARRIHQYELKEKVFLLPRVKGAEVPLLLGGLDMGVYIARRSSGPSRMALEFLSQGVPIVATAVGAVPDYHALDPKAFDMVPRKEDEAIVEGIGALLDNPRRREEMRRHAPELVQRHFRLERLGEDLERMYRAALRRDGVHRSQARTD